MPTITLSKSGTLNPALSRVDNDDLSNTPYAVGDVLSLDNRARFLVNQSTALARPGTIRAISGTPGTIVIENNSIANPIVISLQAETADIYSAFGSNTEVNGKWIVMGTGDGMAGQTLDFSILGPLGVAIDLPPCVWIETGDTRDRYLSGDGLASPGYFKKFWNCYQAADTLGTNILTTYHGDLDHGNFFQFNRSTLVATFGNGGTVATSNGGAVIPNAARILYPNIHFTSTVLHATVASRNEFKAMSQGSCDVSVCAFSPNWVFGRGASQGFFGCGDVTFRDVAVTYGALFQANIGTLTLDGFGVGMNYSEISTTGLQISGGVGPIYLPELDIASKFTSTGTYSIRLNGTSSVLEWGKMWISYHNTSTASGDRNPIYCDYLAPTTDAQLMAGPFYIIGGRSLFIYSSNIHVKEHWSSDRVSAVNDTVVSNAALYLSSTVKFSVGKVRKLTNGASCRAQIVTFDGSPYLCGVSDIVYNGQGNTDSIIATAGKRVYGANASCDNLRLRVYQGSQTSSVKVRNSNMVTNVATQALGAYLSVGSFGEWGMGSSSSWTGVYGGDTNFFNTLWTNIAKTAGLVRIGPLSYDTVEDSFEAVSGVEGTDWLISRNGALFLISSGVDLRWTGKYPIRGITNFTAGTWSSTGGDVNSGVLYEFAMKNPTDETWGSWFDGNTSANWQTALAALTGYDSDIGFELKMKITTSTANSTLYNRWFAYGGMTCTPDSTWTPPEVGFIPMLFSGAVAGSTVRLMVNTVPASPVTVRTASVAGTSDEWDFPYDFNGLSKDYRWKIRKAGYAEFNASGSTYIGGRTNGVLQVQNVIVDEIAAAAITTVVVDGPANTVTVIGDDSISNIYAALQYWGSRKENMDYEIPLVTSDEINYASTYNWILNGGDIAGTGAMNLGAGTLTVTGGETSTLPITSDSGASVFCNVKVPSFVAGSVVRIVNTDDNIELYNNFPSGTSLSVPVIWSANKNIVIYVVKEGYLPFRQSQVLTNSGASFSIEQEVNLVWLENGVNGSTVTECSTDYPNIRFNVNDADNITYWQRIYAWICYAMCDTQGIVYYFDTMKAIDSKNYLFDVSNGDLYMKNMKNVTCTVGGGVCLKSDGSPLTVPIGPGECSFNFDVLKAYVANADRIERKVDASIVVKK